MMMQKKMYVLVEQWQQSGLSKKEFSQKEGLSYDSFLYWSQKYSKEKGIEKGKQGEGFIPLQLVSPSNASDVLIEITYPNGVKANVPSSIGLFEFQKLIQIF